MNKSIEGTYLMVVQLVVEQQQRWLVLVGIGLVVVDIVAVVDIVVVVDNQVVVVVVVDNLDNLVVVFVVGRLMTVQ
jgi:Na+/citrate or Na+/malate symporter